MQNRPGIHGFEVVTLFAVLALAACDDGGSPANPGLDAVIGAPSLTIDVQKNGSVQEVVQFENTGAHIVAASVLSGPAHGTLQLVALSNQRIRVAYTPDPGFFGEDAVGYRIQAPATSDEGTITFNVLNAEPTVSGTTVVRPSTGGVTARLSVVDDDGDPLAFQVSESPEHGSLGSLEVTRVHLVPGQLSIYRVEVRYEPEPGFEGRDAFHLAIEEAGGPSRSTRVDVVPNQPPEIQDPGPDGELAFEGPRGESLEVVIEALSPSGADLEFRLTDGPRQGTLGPIQVLEAGTAGLTSALSTAQGSPGAQAFRGTATYEADSDFAGTEVFEVSVSDGTESVVVPVRVTVENTPPTAESDSVVAFRHRASEIVLAGEDPNGFPLEFEIVEAPHHGILSPFSETETVPGSAGSARTTTRIFYSAESETVDETSFLYTVSDGVDTSEPARIDITLRNRAPFAEASEATVSRNTSRYLTLSARDVDGHALDFTIVDAPEHGILGDVEPTTATTARVLYSPDAGYVGPDGLTFRVGDGFSTSGIAPVTLDVVNQIPLAHDPGPLATPYETPVDLTLTGSDPNGDPLESLEVVFPPQHGSLTGLIQVNATTFQVTYTPDPGFSGPDPFSFRVQDDLAASESRTIQVVVGPPAP